MPPVNSQNRPHIGILSDSGLTAIKTSQLMVRYRHIESLGYRTPPESLQYHTGNGQHPLEPEQWIKEDKYALNWTRLSCQHFVPNQVRLGLFVLAYNLGNFLRHLVLPRRIKHWSLRTLLTKLIKIGAKVVRHSRVVTFQMAEVEVSEEIWAEMLSRIERLRWIAA